MHILIYGNDTHALAELVETTGPLQYRNLVFSKPGCYDEYLSMLSSIAPQLILICQNGAAGMEAVIAAKNLHPRSKIVWFSDDENFGPQSYRPGCSYFAVKPVTREKVQKAFMKEELV